MTKYTKRRYRKRGRKSTTVQLQGNISDSQVVRMIYSDVVSINSTAGIADGVVFSCNSVYNPNRSYPLTSHQPLGHDEWKPFYNHATVIGSKIKATFIPSTSTPGAGNAVCSIKVLGNSTLDTNLYSTLEQTGNKWKIMGNANASNGTTIRHNFSAKKFFCVKDVSDSSNIRGTFGANPADEAYYHLQVQGVTATTDPSNVDVIVTIEYICLLTERRQLAIS